MKRKSKKPIYLNIIRGISIGFIVLLLFFTVIALNVNKDYDDGFLGYKFFIVLSDSMKPNFQSGDIVVTKTVDENSLTTGDIITFHVGDGTVLTHQIYDKSDGKFITKGTNVDQVDRNPVNPNQVIGKYAFSLPKLGKLITFLKTDIGFILCILIPMSLITIISGFEFYKLFKKYKIERKEAEEKKRILLNQEKEKNKKLIEELNQLKKQVSSNNNV